MIHPEKIDKCPFGEQWDKLVDTIGRREAMREWLAVSGDPDASLYPKQRFPGDFEHTWHEEYNGIKDYSKMDARKTYLESTGARVKIQGNGLQVSRTPVEQEKVVNYQKLTEQQKLKYAIQSIIGRSIPNGQQESTVKTINSIFGTAKGSVKASERKRQIVDSLRKEGLIYDKELGEPFEGGVEHVVYRSEDGKNVIKTNITLNTFKEIKEYLQSLLVHNYLFPDTAYNILGLREVDGKLSTVVIQPIIDADAVYDDQVVQNVLRSYRFKRSITGNYTHNTGISLWDIKPSNVLFKEGIPYFIDPKIEINKDIYNSIVPRTEPNVQLDNRLTKGFLKSIGANVQHIPDTGQGYNALADTVRGIIKVVDGKADRTTLGHEATHMFLDLLPDGSKLLNDIIRDVKNREEYDNVYEQYKNDPEYLNSDGTVNEEKMAKEATAHIIDDIIADRFDDKKAMKWWERLWNWIKDLFSGKSLDNYQQVAKDILDNNTSKLSKSKIQKMKEAAGRGEIYYQKSPEVESRANKQKESATDVQKAMIDSFILNPTEATNASKKLINDLGIIPTPIVVLEPISHIYTDPKTGESYKSTTGQISGKFPEDKQKMYEANKNAGNAFDKLLEHVINDTPIDKIMNSVLDMPFSSQDRMRDFLTDAGNIVRDEQEDGSKVFAQVITSDPISKVAGSKDLCSFQPEGTERIIDLKTSIRTVYDKNGKIDKELSKTYTSKWVQNPGSVFNELTEKKDSKGVLSIVPRENGDKPVLLSKNQQHGIQVGSYAKMDELQGIPVISTKTWHIQVDIQQKEDGTFVIKDYKNEGLLDHPVERNQLYIDQVIPTPVDDKNMSELQKKWLDISDVEEPGEVYEPTPEEVASAKESLHITLDKIKKEFIRRKASALDDTRETSLNELKNTVADIQNLQDKDDIQQAMAKALGYIGDITTNSLKFLSRDENYDHDQYFQFLKEAQLIAASNNELLPPRIRKDLTDTQQKVFDNIKANISELQEIAGIRAKEYVLRNIATGSDPDRPIDISVLEDEWFPKQGIKDISLTGSWATNHDALNNKIIQEAVHIAQLAEKTTDIENVTLAEAIAEQGNAFAEVAKEAMKDKTIWNRFYELETITDAKGNKKQVPTTYIKLIGDKYNEIADRHKSALLDDKGEFKKYIPIRVKEDASQKDLDYNIELYYAKDANRKFNEPERLSDGKIIDGEYHHLSDTYKAAQDNIFKVVLHRNYDGDIVGYERVLKGGLSEDSREVKEFRNRYQVRDKYESMTKGADKKPTGVVVEKEGWFPNRKHVEVNESAVHINPDGSTDTTDMRNPRYIALMKDQTPLGRAAWTAYNYFMKEYIAGATQAQGEAERFVRKLGIIPLQAKMFQTAAKTGTMNNLKYQAIEFFTAVHKSNIEKTDADGITRMQLHIPYIGSLRSKEQIAKIEKEILELSKKKDTMGKTAYRNALNTLNAQIEAESHKLSGEDIELDLFKQLMAYRTGINTYVGKKNIEGKLLALYWALKEQKFIKTTTLGVAKTDAEGNPVYKADGDINAQRAMAQLIKNYYGISIEDSTLGVFIKRFQNLTTLGVMGLNILNGINNTFLYQLNHASQALAGKYGMSAKNWAKGQKELAKYTKGIIQKKFDKAIKYGDKRPYSEAEAFFRKYQIKVDQMKTEGVAQFLGRAYIFEQFAIDSAQVALAITGGYSYTVKNHDTGDIVPIYGEGGAHTYDPNTGDYTLNKGFKHEDVLKQIVKIGDAQRATQGNFTPLTQPAMRQTILGRLLTQFKQFFAPSFNNRFTQKYTHRTLGEQEGTWRSVVSLVEMLREYDGKWQEAFNPKSEFWKETPDYIKQNLMFDALDMIKLLVLFGIGMGLRSLADDVPESDPNQRRWMNFLAYTASRLRFEQQMFNPVFGWVQMGEFVQNPIAMSNTLRTFAEAMYLSTEFPFQADDDSYYHNGVFKGQSKAAHQWERIIPIARMHSRWISLTESQDAEGSVLGAQGH